MPGPYGSRIVEVAFAYGARLPRLLVEDAAMVVMLCIVLVTFAIEDEEAMLLLVW